MLSVLICHVLFLAPTIIFFPTKKKKKVIMLKGTERGGEKKSSNFLSLLMVFHGVILALVLHSFVWPS